MLYAFILGRLPALSIAEVAALSKRQKDHFNLLAMSRQVALIEGKDERIVHEQFGRLGGSIKLVGIIKRLTQDVGAEDILPLLPKGVRKVWFGISQYALSTGGSQVDEGRLGMDVKKILRAEGVQARFVTSRETALSSVVVSTNKLLGAQGAEIVLIRSRQGIWIGKTLAVQAYEDFSLRDYGRPGRDARRGMLPPKLARMLVNLAQAEPDATILDPFCGSGTILQEALLLRIKNVIGFDMDAQAVEKARRNMEWFVTRYKIQDTRYKLEACDARKLSQCIKGAVDAIVTETYLGPPLLRPVSSPQEIQKVKAGLEELYRAALKEFQKVLMPHGRVVMVWPAWPVGRYQVSGITYLDWEKIIEDTGLVTVNPLPQGIVNPYGVHDGCIKERKSLLYYRQNQYVYREIRIFMRRMNA